MIALPYVWLLLATGAIRLWQSQRHWPLRLLGTAWILVLALLVSLLSSWPQVVLTLAIALLLLFMTELISFFFTQQDAVFAIGLDQMMAQYSQEVQDLYANMRGWRHDYHDHLQALKAYLDDQHVAEARNYLDSLEERLDTVDTLIHSGNVLLDAIMNAKLTLAEHAHIPTNAKVFVGTRPLIKDLDLVVIVGNLMDNALEAIEEQPDGEMRRLRVYIAILKQQLYISVTNSRPRDQTIDFHYASTKNDKRGLGIRRINKLVSKYGGMINRQYEDEVFVTEIAIPLAQSK
ncbi:sensor histidine kinase [Oenococcus kitaharae]|uniref:sensor histidine kinase n=1 Tax=Oenococcus TaxID=46254 RepID=UPI003990E552